MSKKVWIAGLLALALIVSVAGVGYAASSHDQVKDPLPPRGGGRQQQGPPHVTGEISAVGSDQFTLSLRGNNELTVEVDKSTVYLGSLSNFAALDEGMEVVVTGERSGEGALLAKTVTLDEDLPLGARMGGEVTAVGSTTLTILDGGGHSWTFNVISTTDFLSRDDSVQSLTDIAVGDHVIVIFVQASNNTLTAIVISGGPGPEDGAPEGSN